MQVHKECSCGCISNTNTKLNENTNTNTDKKQMWQTQNNCHKIHKILWRDEFTCWCIPKDLIEIYTNPNVNPNTRGDENTKHDDDD